MFSFDKLNRHVARIGKVPLIAEIMPTRWTYEALMVCQFKDNRYSSLKYNTEGETFYSIEKKISIADFNNVHRLPELIKVIQNTLSEYGNPDSSELVSHNLRLIKTELSKISELKGIPDFKYTDKLDADNFTPGTADSLKAYIQRMGYYFREVSNSAVNIKDRFFDLNREKLRRMEREFYNYRLEEIVTKYFEPDKILRFKDSFIQNTDPVYLDPEKKGFINIRTHFFAPSKYIMGITVDTFSFNISMIFAGAIILYIILYFDLLTGLVKYVSKIRSRK
jgi:hypothetical protein